jgi:hypothetical protein
MTSGIFNLLIIRRPVSLKCPVFWVFFKNNTSKIRPENSSGKFLNWFFPFSCPEAGEYLDFSENPVNWPPQGLIELDFPSIRIENAFPTKAMDRILTA